MKKETNNRKNKLNIAKILSLVCLSLLMFGIFIGANNPEESTIISNIKHRKVFVISICIRFSSLLYCSHQMSIILQGGKLNEESNEKAFDSYAMCWSYDCRNKF